MNSAMLLAALQDHLQQRAVNVEALTVDPAIDIMLDWFDRVPIAGAAASPATDALVHSYGGWSEGCVTGFKFSVLRRVTQQDASGAQTDWLAGITLMFEPSKYAGLEPFSTESTDWQSLDAFRKAIRSSPAYAASAAASPMSVMVESGGLR